MIVDISQLNFIHKKMRGLVDWLERETGIAFTVTSLYRIGDPGVHGSLPLRGVDVRCRSKVIGLAVVEVVNGHWQYDHTRPDMKCAILHGEGMNLHLHLQVHDNTRRIN